MKTILFQGDSITDAGRDRENESSLGTGYSFLASASLGYECPGEYKCINKGISGNRITDVYARIKSDILNLKPDVMSLLIGVNDVWHELDWKNGVSEDKFYTIYSMLIKEIKAELPNIKIMILEPFAVEGVATESRIDLFRGEVVKRAEVARKIAEEFDLVFIPLQDKFDAACESAPDQLWTTDGVHPAPAGHELIKREWLNAFASIK